MTRRALYVAAHLHNQDLFAVALEQIGWHLSPCVQLDHALARMKEEQYDALIVHGPLPGGVDDQELFDRIHRATGVKMILLGFEELRDNRFQRVVPAPITAADLVHSVASICPPQSQKLVTSLLRSQGFAPFTQEAVAFLLSKSRAIQLETGDRLFNEGDEGNTMYFILAGSIALQLGKLDLPPLTVGALFGEMSMLQGIPRSATASASRTTVLLEVPAAVVEQGDSDFRSILFELIARTLMRRLQRSNTIFSNLQDAEIVEVSEALAEAAKDENRGLGSGDIRA